MPAASVGHCPEAKRYSKLALEYDFPSPCAGLSSSRTGNYTPDQLISPHSARICGRHLRRSHHRAHARESAKNAGHPPGISQSNPYPCHADRGHAAAHCTPSTGIAPNTQCSSRPSNPLTCRKAAWPSRVGTRRARTSAQLAAGRGQLRPVPATRACKARRRRPPMACAACLAAPLSLLGPPIPYRRRFLARRPHIQRYAQIDHTPGRVVVATPGVHDARRRDVAHAALDAHRVSVSLSLHQRHRCAPAARARAQAVKPSHSLHPLP